MALQADGSPLHLLYSMPMLPMAPFGRKMMVQAFTLDSFSALNA